MRHLIIRNFGPLNKVDINLGQVNVIIGFQSSGKSCVLKTACYCSWLEKRIELAQGADELANSTKFIDDLVAYYKMKSYICNDTYIEYSSDYMTFSYDHKHKNFILEWGEKRWDYQKTKVSYVPSDRNIVAAIPAWSKLSLDYDNLLDFMGDWNVARQKMKVEENILNLGLAYVYDSASNTDKVKMNNGRSMLLSEGSSGVQSLVPLIVHLDYLSKGLYDIHESTSLHSYEEKEARKKMLSILYRKANKNDMTADGKEMPCVVKIDGTDFFFHDAEDADDFAARSKHYLNYQHNEIFLEEPEDNLFPPTQCQLVNWLLDDVMSEERNDFLFVATHSPYVLDQMIKYKPENFRLLFTHQVSENGKYDVKSLSDEEIEDVYSNGVDLFFNFESYV